MPIEEFIIKTYCLIDDLYQELFPNPLRTRGFEPKLSDSEVIAIEMANLKLILDVEVHPGGKGNSKHSLPSLMSLLSAAVQPAYRSWRFGRFVPTLS